MHSQTWQEKKEERKQLPDKMLDQHIRFLENKWYMLLRFERCVHQRLDKQDMFVHFCRGSFFFFKAHLMSLSKQQTKTFQKVLQKAQVY